MGRLKVALVAVLLTITCQTTAQAHLPHFTTVQPIVLPDGKPGELRFWERDGFPGSDLIRVLALDSEGHIIALTHESHKMSLSCNGGNCRVFDLEHNEVLELEPSTFRRGALPLQGDVDSDKYNDFLYGDEEWGWRAREAGDSDELAGNIALTRRLSLFRIGFFVALSWISVTIGRAGVVFLRGAFSRMPLNGQPRGLIHRGVGLSFGVVALYLSLQVMWLNLVTSDDMTVWIWLVSFCAGAYLSFTKFRILSIIAQTGSALARATFSHTREKG